MTWVIGAASVFGYCVMLSDVRVGVTFRDGHGGHAKELSRADARLRTVETASAILAAWRVAAVSLLAARSP